jgi:hypothetical protein
MVHNKIVPARYDWILLVSITALQRECHKKIRWAAKSVKVRLLKNWTQTWQIKEFVGVWSEVRFYEFYHSLG